VFIVRFDGAICQEKFKFYKRKLFTGALHFEETVKACLSCYTITEQQQQIVHCIYIAHVTIILNLQDTRYYVQCHLTTERHWHTWRTHTCMGRFIQRQPPINIINNAIIYQWQQTLETLTWYLKGRFVPFPSIWGGASSWWPECPGGGYLISTSITKLPPNLERYVLATFHSHQ
jgi:hypothetical protein